MTMLITRWISMWFLGQIHPNGPEIGPAFSSIFMFIVIFVLLKIYENLAFATCLYHGGVFWHFISIRVYEKFLFHCSGNSNTCWPPSNNVTFFGWFFISPKRQRFFSIASTCITWSLFTELKKHTRATKHDVCSPNAQSNTKCVHWIKTHAHNVTWSAFTELKHTRAT